MPQKIKRREGHKKDKRKEGKMPSKKERDSNANILDRQCDFLSY